MVVIPLSLGLAAAPVISKMVPKLYRSDALIRVVPQRVPDSFVKSMLTEKMEDRLPSISSVILSRSRLERIVKDFNLYGPYTTPVSIEDLVQRLRKNIDVKPEGQESFRVTFVSSDPRLAQRVTGRLASLYVEENLRDRANLADETNAFLESQLKDAKDRLVQHEKKLEAYRKEHAGELPSQLESNLQTIRNAQLQLQSVYESANRTRERRLLLERQIADLQSLPIDSVTVAADGTAKADAGGGTPAQRLEIARAQLESYRLKFKADHPDLRAAERNVRELEARVQEEGQRPEAPPSAQVMTPAQAVRQKRIGDLQAELDVIDHQLTASQSEEKRLKDLMTAYQDKVDVVPTRESELVELTRDYSTIQMAYQSLLTKREDSKIAANLERREIGEQFKILDPASLPERPYNQSQRLAIIASGGGAGLVLGLLLVGFLEYRDASFATEEDVVRLLALPVLATVPVIETPRDRRVRQLRIAAGNVAAAVAFISSAVVLVIWRLRR
jgi:polysaccharide chain length determinant protein (PEP-CTERM system associated)